MLERYFTPYHSDSAVSGGRIAILAPHPDDEIFGCGASACKWHEQGKQVQVFVLTSGVVRGEFGNQANAERLRKDKEDLRAEESRQAALQLGLPIPEFLQGQDGDLWNDDQAMLQTLLKRLENWQPTTIVLPSIWEMHRDHRATAEIGIELMQQLSCKVERLAFYEVGVPSAVNVIEDVSLYQERKWQAMQCFPSQLKEQDYAEQIAGLNKFRSYTLGKSVTYAEAFYCVERDQIEAFSQHHCPSKMSLILRHAEQLQSQQESELRHLQDRVGELERMLWQMHQSLSWRVTKPLRKVKSWFRKLRYKKF